MGSTNSRIKTMMISMILCSKCMYLIMKVVDILILIEPKEVILRHLWSQILVLLMETIKIIETCGSKKKNCKERNYIKSLSINLRIELLNKIEQANRLMPLNQNKMVMTVTLTQTTRLIQLT